MKIPQNTLFIRCTTNADTPGGTGAGHRIIFKNRARGWTMTDITAFKDYYAPMAIMRVIIEHSDNVEIVTSVKNTSVYRDDIRQGLEETVYNRLRKDFPHDIMVEDVNRKLKFCDVIEALLAGKGHDIYDYIGADDSIIREKVFTELSEILDVDYDVIYNLWLNRTPVYPDKIAV